MSSIKAEFEEYRLGVYDKVNQCETLKQLSEVILELSHYGIVEGRTRHFDGVHMANHCERLEKGSEFRVLTRMYGIRQQAIYIVHS